MSDEFFVGEICFTDDELDGTSGLELAMAAEREFRAAGYETNITADLDELSNAAWLIIGRPSNVDLWEDVDKLAKEWGGCFSEGGLGDLDAFWRERLYNPESERN
jgi:hypothetical protein